MTMLTNNDALVLVSVRQTTGVLELNRPQALNSLNYEMIKLIARALEEWRHDSRITQVLITSTSAKAFCAGGDVRDAREKILEGKDEEVDRFMAEEYQLNHTIATYPKPYVAIMDGITMGGGLGLFAHGSHRFLTQKSWASMPEMAIGYITDVGISWASQRWSGSSPAIGAFIGLTGYRLTPADMLFLGLATHSVADVDAVVESLITDGAEAAAAAHGQVLAGESHLATLVLDIEATFGRGSWELIDAALNSHPNSEFVNTSRELMAGASPSALVANAELYAANRTVPDVRAGLDNELVLGELIRRQPDFVEGVRAVLVDKTRDAEFAPAQTAEKYQQVLKRS